MKLRLFLLIVAGVLATAHPQAFLMRSLPLNELSAEADLVVQGKIRSLSTEEDSAGRIVTRMELEILDIWKGAPPETPFKIVQAGGILGERKSMVSGQARFTLNEEVVVFLALNERKEGVVLGLSQGKFEVWREKDGQAYVANPFHGRRQERGGGGIERHQDSVSAPLTLDHLKGLVTREER